MAAGGHRGRRRRRPGGLLLVLAVASYIRGTRSFHPAPVRWASSTSAAAVVGRRRAWLPLQPLQPSPRPAPLRMLESSSSSPSSQGSGRRQRPADSSSSPKRSMSSSSPPPPPTSNSGGSGKPLGGRAIQALLHENEGSSAALIGVIEAHVAGFEKQNCAMAMNRLSKAALAERARGPVANHPATQRLIERTGMLLHTFNSIELSNTINGLSKLGRNPGRVFMQAFTEAVSAALWTFNAQELSNLLNGFANLNHQPGDDVLSRVVLEAEAKLTDFNAQELAIFVNALGRLAAASSSSYLPPRIFMEKVRLLFEAKMADFPPQNVANLLGAFPKLGFTPPLSFWDKTLPAMQHALPAFKPQEISTVTNALAKLEVDPGPAFVAALGKEYATRMGEFSPQDLSVSLVSLARLGHDPSPAFLSAALAAAHQLLPRCNAQDLSLLITGLARWEVQPSKGFLRDFMERTLQTLEDFTPQGLGHTLRSLASLLQQPTRPPAAFMDAFMRRVDATAAALTYSDAVLLAGGLSKLDHEGSPTFNQALLRLLMGESASDAPARKGGKGGRRQRNEGCVELLHANELAVVLNFLTRSKGGENNGPVNPIPATLLARLLAACYQRLPLFGPTSLASTAFSLSRLAATSPAPVPFLDALRDHASTLLPAFNPQELSNVLLAFARLTYHPGAPFLKALAAQAATCLPRFTPQGLANTLNAFAKFSFDPGARFWQRAGLLLFTENDNERTKATLSLSLFEVASLLWSLAVLDSPHTAAVAAYLMRYAAFLLLDAKGKGAAVTEDVLIQLRQALLHTRGQGTTSGAAASVDSGVGEEPVAAVEVKPTKHRRRAAAASTKATTAKPTAATATATSGSSAPPQEVLTLFESALAEFPHVPETLEERRATMDARRSGSRAPTVSALQQEVSGALEALGLALQREVDDGGVFQYDFVVEGNGKGPGRGLLLPVVVEVDGSPHFFANDLKQPLGDTRFKRRLVRAQGHRYAGLVPIPWYDWRAATSASGDADEGGKLAAVREYLRGAFAEQGLDLDDYLPPGASSAGTASVRKGRRAAAGAAKRVADAEAEGPAAAAPAAAPVAKRRGRPPKSKPAAAAASADETAAAAPTPRRGRKKKEQQPSEDE